MSRVPFKINASNLAGGYYAQTKNREATQLTQPSVNVRYTDKGAAKSRKGYYNIGWDLGEAGKKSTPLHIPRYNVTFFAVNNSVYFVDHNKSDTVVDTGITLSGLGEDTDIKEYNGDVYLTNTTDGLLRIVLTRLNGSVSTGAATITIEKDGAARLSVFSKTTGNLRIDGTDEAFNAVTVSTGVVTLVGTSSDDYDDDTVVMIYHDISSGRPKGSQIEFWKETMNIIGVTGDGADANTDTPPSTLYFSAFATHGASENIISFSALNYEMAGKGGALTNLIATRDYLYAFKENEAYFISVGSVNLTSGARPLNLFSPKYGTYNEKTVDVMGDFVAWLSPQKRIIKSNIRIQDGTSVLYVDEEFDRPLKEFLDVMDDDQSNALVYYQTKAKELHVKVSIAGQYIEFVYDVDKGVWCPPDTNKLFFKYFEIDGNPYATSDNDDTIFKLDDGTDDDGADIECCIATGVYEYSEGRTWCEWKPINVSGAQSTGSTIEYTNITEQGESGVKEITTPSTVTGSSIGQITVGSAIIGGGESIEELNEFDQRLSVTPKARQMQHKFYSYGAGHEMLISSWSQDAKAYTRELLTTK